MIIHSEFQIVPARNKKFDMIMRKPFLERTEAEYALTYFMLKNIDVFCYFVLGTELLPYQSIILRMLIKKPFSMILLTRGGGKCISGDSICLTDKGFVEIKNLCHNDFGEKENIHKMYGESGFKQTTHSFVNPPEQLFKVETNNGYHITGTKEHPVRIIENGEIVWKKLGELDGKEFVIINRDSSYDFHGDFDSLSVEFGRVMGLLVGDGCFTKKILSGIGFTNSEKELSDFVMDNVKVLDTKFCCIKRKTQKIEYRINCGSRKNKLDFFVKYGLREGLSETKEIPTSILRSNKMVLASFISGYAAADGGMDSKGISFSSKSYRLLNQLQICLLTFGIISKLRPIYRKKYGRYWELSIRGGSVLIFDREIGFGYSRKDDELKSFIRNRKFNTNNDLLRTCKLLLKELSKAYNLDSSIKRGKLSNLLSTYNIDIYDYSYEKLTIILDLAKCSKNRECYKKLNDILRKHYFFDKISKINRVDSKISYDVHIPDGHNFLSNGIISHNTFLLGVYGCLRCCILPGSKIVMVGSNRRQSRFIFDESKKIYYNKNASLFREMVPKPPNDLPEASSMYVRSETKTSSIMALPLAAGDRIRGARSSHLLVDEFNIIPEDVYKNILAPTSSVSLNPVEKSRRMKREKELIDAGVIVESDRMEFADNQVVASSSASYAFTYMHSLYQEFKNKIIAGKDTDDPIKIKEAAKYGIFQCGADAILQINPGYLDSSNVEQARSTFSKDRFMTEYGAQWAVDSLGEFPRSLLETRQIKMGEFPSVEITGKANDIYIAAVDPSSGSNEKNDWFAIVVLKLDMVTKRGYIVYASASTGKGWPYYISEVRKVIKKFNPRFIGMDAYGGGIQVGSLLTSAEYCEIGKDKILKTLDKDDLSTYSWIDNRILRLITPTPQWNENANSNFKSLLEHAQFYFSGSIGESIYTTTKSEEIDEYESISERIEEAKNQISLIVGTQGSNGLVTFAMPEMMSKTRKKDRSRKDLYSAVLIAAWGMKEYLEICNAPSAQAAQYSPTVSLA